MRKIVVALLGLFFVLTISNVYAVEPKKWTMLVYVNGNNNLDQWGTRNIIDMEKVGSNDQVNVVVQWASLKTRKSLRLLVEKSNNPTKVTSPILQDLGLVDMGDYHSLQDFIKWGVDNFPAEHYFIVVWNHGGGWQKNKIPALKDISYDEISGHQITTEQLGQVLGYSAKIIGHKIDLYASDACLMAMAEVANEMVDSVDYFAGSEQMEPAEGWPYTALLSRWEAIPNATADQIASILVDAYVKFYREKHPGFQVTFSAFDLRKLAALNQAIAQLGVDIRNLGNADRNKAYKALIDAHAFNFIYGDFLDFVNRLAIAKVSINPEDVTKAQSAAQDFIIANSSNPLDKTVTGLSIWMPGGRKSFDPHKDRYSKLRFNLETQWGDTLDFLLQNQSELATRQ